MKFMTCWLFLCIGVKLCATSPFKPLPSEQSYGVTSATWCFASSLSKEATGIIELCYIEEGGKEQILGRVIVRPFRSSDEKMPDLRILYTTAEIDSRKMVVLVVGYGMRSGCFVVAVPGLTSHSLVFAGQPSPDSKDEITLSGYGEGGVGMSADGMLTGVKGRLYFRYVEGA